MHPAPKLYKRGQWLLWGAALGAFIGLLVGKFAIGLIAGFFIGAVIDKAKQNAAAGKQDGDRADE